MSRTTANVSDATVQSWINEAQRQFAKDVDGFESEYYLALLPNFDLNPNSAFTLVVDGNTYSDIVFTSNQCNKSGTDTASALQTAIRAKDAALSSATVTWSATTKKFTITTGSSITISSPSSTYHDFGAVAFGLKTATSPFVGDEVSCVGTYICTVEATLPSDYLQIYSVDYAGTVLPQDQSRRFEETALTGTPVSYAVRGRQIRLFPTPTDSGLVHIRYKAIPADMTTGSDISTVPTHYHSALYYFAAAKLAESNFELEIADRHLRNYYTDVRRYTQEVANDNSKIAFTNVYSTDTVMGAMLSAVLTK